ncbi:CD225/dispanin family protein [Amycolatopsis palatopharyngis]|uniref:CD225/dispanin family protein n=1 Tax=Amycolatopsis palatopharyngis TaxID=187982 RepID=UPI003CCC8840
MNDQYPQYPQNQGGQDPHGGYGQAPQPGPVGPMGQPWPHGQQGQYGGYGYGPPPENHLVWAILSTVLCCLPLGIVSIVKSNQVQTLWAQGYPTEAQKAANDAKKWAMWSAIVAGIGVLLYIAFIVVGLVVAGVSLQDSLP